MNLLKRTAMPATTTTHAIPRQGHRKSRRGCTRCKQRRVKCDEKTPCSNCVRRNEDCDLIFPRVPYRCPNCVARDVQVAKFHISQASESPSASTEASGAMLATTTSVSDWNRDMYLMHQWTRHTAASIAKQNEAQRIWTEVAPALAIDYPMLTHGLLTVSALHLAYLRPDESMVWLPLSFKHQMAAIAAFREAIPTINEENCHALFALASIISIASMAWSSRAKSPSELLTVQDILEPFFLTRGVGEVVGVALDWIRTGPMHTLLNGHSFDVDHVQLPADTHLQFQRLRELITGGATGDNSESQNILIQHLEHLQRIYREVYFRKDHIKDEFGTLWKFAAMSSSEFVGMLRESHPSALVLYAHFAILSTCLIGKWCLLGWPERALASIAGALPLDFQQWVRWPEEQLRNGLSILMDDSGVTRGV